MTILNRMANDFRLAASRKGASEQQIAALTAFFQQVGQELPHDYLEMLREATEVELLVGNIGCIRFWSPPGVIELNEVHDLQSYIPSGVAVGDDEGGATYVLMNGTVGPGLYRTSFADPDPDEAVFIAESLAHLLVDGRGREQLFDWE
jgi:hypothetical protein